MEKKNHLNVFLNKSAFGLLFFLSLLIYLLPINNMIFAQTLDEGTGYFNQGDFSKAKTLFLDYLEANPQDPSAWFYLGKMEFEGKKSVDYLEKAWKNEKFEKSDKALVNLIQYGFSRGFYVSAIDLAEKFETAFPSDPLLKQVLWMHAHSLLASDKAQDAQKLFLNIIKKSPNSEWASWAQLGLGDIYFSKKDCERAIEEYKKVLNLYPESEVLSLALFQLSLCYHELNQDKSLLYGNLYKEKFPKGIQNPEEMEPTESAVQPKKQTPAEQIAGISYTIQVGIFGIKGNALKQMGEFKKKGFVCKIQDKIIEGKRYYQVLVGKFSSEEKALEIKEKLEKEDKEFYKITLW
jgi:TolA-binding protein